MNWNELKENKWIFWALTGSLVAASCATAVLCVLLFRFEDVAAAVGTFIGHFRTVIIGGALAYMMNPIAMLIESKILSKTKLKDNGWGIAVLGALIIVVLFLSFLVGLVIPQLATSISSFAERLASYQAEVTAHFNRLGVDITKFLPQSQMSFGSLEDTLASAQTFLSKNGADVMNFASGAGHGVATFLISFILSVYLLSAKKSIKAGAIRLTRALLKKDWAEKVLSFFDRCNFIFIHYVSYSVIEGVLVGAINAVFMMVMKMPFVGLVSVMVGLTNLIPTVGPLIGGVIGGFVLFLANPMQAAIFLVFTVVLQFCDGYVIKPRLFGNTLGVSGVLIMIAIVVGGNMFGILGILLSIPVVAILDMIYKEYLMPALERYREKHP